MSQPLLFLDVDGVLNCLKVGAGYDVVQPDPDGLIATVPPGTRERLHQVLPLYEPVWATAWQGRAHSHFREFLDLPAESWPYVKYSDLKLPQILRHAAGRPFAWVDDDVEFELRNLNDAFREFDDVLYVQPQHDVGLTDEHVDQLIEFAQKLQTR